MSLPLFFCMFQNMFLLPINKHVGKYPSHGNIFNDFILVLLVKIWH